MSGKSLCVIAVQTSSGWSV